MPGHESPPSTAPAAGSRTSGEAQDATFSTVLIVGLGVACVIAVIAVLYALLGGRGGAPAPSQVSVPPADTAAALPAPGQWSTTTEPAAGGGTDAYAMVGAFEALAEAPGAARPTLAVRCAGGNADVYITWFVDAGPSETIELQTQVDERPSGTATWSVSTDRQSTFYEGDARALLQDWTASRRLQTRLSPPGMNPVNATFDLSGLPAVLPAIGQACGWN